ncbi:MAG: hypothetical protein WA581_12350, partial [Candidatus Acidiferrales bacterium]
MSSSPLIPAQAGIQSGSRLSRGRAGKSGRAVTPVSLDTLNAADRKAFAAALREVMELAPWVADEAYA